MSTSSSTPLLEPLHCDECERQIGYAYSMDLNGSYFFCNDACGNAYLIKRNEKEAKLKAIQYKTHLHKTTSLEDQLYTKENCDCDKYYDNPNDRSTYHHREHFGKTRHTKYIDKYSAVTKHELN